MSIAAPVAEPTTSSKRCWFGGHNDQDATRAKIKGFLEGFLEVQLGKHQRKVQAIDDTQALFWFLRRTAN